MEENENKINVSKIEQKPDKINIYKDKSQEE